MADVDRPIGLDPNIPAAADPGVEVDTTTEKVTPGKPGEPDELQVEVDESDPLYKKPDWKTDPARNVDDPNDKDYGPRVQKRIDKLRASLSEAAKQREKAARERDDAINLTRAHMSKIAELERQLQTGSAFYLDRQADAEEANARAANLALRQALTLGDPDAIAKANSDLVSATTKATQFKTAADIRKAQIHHTPQQQQIPQQSFQQQAPPQTDPNLNSWAERNSWFQTDQEMTDHAFEVHYELEKSGVPVGSPSYYKIIDKKMREQFPEFFGEDKPQDKRPSSPLAPASRSVSSQANQPNPNRIKLSASQVATASKLGLTPQQYAKELIRLRSEGVNV